MDARSSATRQTNYYQAFAPANAMEGRTTNNTHSSVAMNPVYHAYQETWSRVRKDCTNYEEEDRNRKERCHRRRQRRQDSVCTSNRHVWQQRRAQSMRDREAVETCNDQFRVFVRGVKRYQKRNDPSFSDLVNHVDKQHNRRKKRAQHRKQLRVNALELATAERRAREVVQKEVEEIRKSGEYGHVSKTKPDNTIRIVF